MPQITPYVPESFGRYVEPFCGSAALFFEIQPARALLADVNPELINMYKVVQHGYDVHSALSMMDCSKPAYYEVRAMDASRLNEFERAVRFLYLNRLCFNGVYRTNSSGRFNVPYGSRTGSFPSASEFGAFREALLAVDFLTADFMKTLSQTTADDFVYLDPPYFKRSRYSGEYGPGSFTESDFASLLTVLDELSSKGTRFLLSYKFDVASVLELQKRYIVHHIDVRRHVSGFHVGWSVENEILVTNYV